MKTSQAAALIHAAKTRRGPLPPPQNEAMGELQAILIYNDSVTPHLHVSREDTVQMLRGYGWAGGRYSLDALCKTLGRKSYTIP